MARPPQNMVSPSCTSPYGPCQTRRIPEARAGYGVWPTRKGKELVQQKSCTNELMMKENKAHIPFFGVLLDVGIALVVWHTNQLGTMLLGHIVGGQPSLCAPLVHYHLPTIHLSGQPSRGHL